MRRFLAAAALSFLASPLHAGWTVFNAEVPPYGLGGFETSIVAVGPDPRDICLALSVVPFSPYEDVRGDIWCLPMMPWGNREWVLQRRFVTNNERASVDASARRGEGFRPHWVISDPANGNIWYGVADEPPELITPTAGFSVSLSHFSDGAPVVTYNGFPPDNHVYYAEWEGKWTVLRLTNNFTYPPIPPFDRSVASAVRHDVVHVAYWDQTYSAVRYATKPRYGAWKFETVLEAPGGRLLPSIAADGEGRPHIAFAHPDGKLHVFVKQGESWTHEAVSIAPGTSIPYRKVAWQIDRTGTIHAVLSARNGNDPLLLYLQKARGASWGEPEIVDQYPGEEPDGYYGISLTLGKDPLSLAPQPRVSYMFHTLLGLVRIGFRTRD